MATIDVDSELAIAQRSHAAAVTVQLLMAGANSNVLSRAWNEILPERLGGGPAIYRTFILRGFRSIGGGVALGDVLGNTYIVFQGVTSATARFLLYGWASESAMRRYNGMNSASYQDAEMRFLSDRNSGLSQTRNVYLYGHSAGGVVAECLALVLSELPFAGIREIISFGMPKPGLSQAPYERTGLRRIRWMNLSDPVVALPYSPGPNGVSIALDLLSSDYSPTRIEQPAGGRVLFSDGQWSDAELTAGAIDPGNLGVAAWLTYLDASIGFPHSIQTYVRNLARLQTRLEDDRETHLQSSPHVIHRRTLTFPSRLQPSVNSLPDPGIVTITGNVAVKPGGPTFLVTLGDFAMSSSQSRIIPSLRLRSQRSGSVYIVRWDDVVLFTCPYASQARSIASSWNRSLRLLGKTSNITQASVYAYLEMIFAAGAAGNGVTPSWHVT